MTVRRIVEPATEPVSLAEAKLHLRVADATDDTLITALIKAARQVAENELRRSLITQTWRKTLDEFPDAIVLPYPPIIGITSVTYTDTAGVPQTLSSASYTLDNTSEPGYLVPAFDLTWPDLRYDINSVAVTYTSGYGAAAAVPEAIKQWIMLMIGHYYEHREATVPGISITPLPFIAGLLDPFRIMSFA